jgi:hypothetical protein
LTSLLSMPLDYPKDAWWRVERWMRNEKHQDRSWCQKEKEKKRIGDWEHVRLHMHIVSTSSIAGAGSEFHDLDTCSLLASFSALLQSVASLNKTAQ